MLPRRVLLAAAAVVAACCWATRGVSAGRCVLNEGAGNESTAPLESGQYPSGVCTWYENDSCCNLTKAAFVDEFMTPNPNETDFPCKNPSQACVEVTNLILCLACSPDQEDFVDPTSGRVRICTSLAERWYTVCEADETKIGRECVHIGDTYASGTQYFAANAAIDSEEGCFNAATHSTTTSLLVLLLAAAAAAAWGR